MKFSFNLIKDTPFINYKINIKKIEKILKNNGFEINSIKNIKFENLNSLLGKVDSIKKIKNDLYVLNINIGKKNINLNLNYKKFRKNELIILIKIKDNKNNIKYHISNNIYFNLNLKKLNIGCNLNKYINIKKDKIIDISIPFNRPDCFNMIGLSREINNNLEKNKKPTKTRYTSTKNNYLNVILNSNNINYYFCKIITNLNINNNYSIIIKNYLTSLDIKLKNNIEDIIEYIFLKTGYCINLIDFDKIKSGIKISDLKNNYLINEINYNYIPIIEDFNNNLLLIPNIINSNITNNTNRIFLGCGTFNSSNIKIKLCNDIIKNNFHKYNTGKDFNLLKHVINFSTKIIIDSYGGTSKTLIKLKNKIITKKIKLDFNNIRKKIGCFIRNKTILKIIKSINCIINKKYIKKNILYIESPIYRSDIHNEEDIIEEIIKLYGVNKIKPKSINYRINYNYKKNKKLVIINKIKKFLVYKGYNEVINYSIVNPYDSFYNTKNINIKNPISKNYSSIRNSLIPGLLNNIYYNKNRKINNIKIFEYGICFNFENNIFIEKKIISSAIVIEKNKLLNDYKNNILFEIKSDLENILLFFIDKKKFYFKKSKVNNLNENTSLLIKYKKKTIGYFGIIKKKILKKFINNFFILIFELNLNLININKSIHIKDIPKLPYIYKDLSFYISKNINTEFIFNSLYNFDKKIIKLDLIDIFFKSKESNIYKNLTIRLYIINNINLKSYEINKFLKKYIIFLKKKFNIIIKDNYIN